MRQFRNLAKRTFLVGVGAQKAGSTWLFDYLHRHPEVAMSPFKGLHFFDQIYRADLCGMWPKEFDRQAFELIGQMARDGKGSLNHLQALIDRVRMNADPTAYLEYFDRLATHDRPVVGEITPSYSLLPEEGFAAARRTIIDAGALPRIVFIMRDPVQRFWSQCRFESAVPPVRTPAAVLESALHDRGFLERARYDLTVARLKAVFAPEELLLLFYEDLFLAPSIERICDFLGITFVMPNSAEQINVSVAGALDPARHRQLRDMLAPVYAFAEAEFGDALPASWHAAR